MGGGAARLGVLELLDAHDAAAARDDEAVARDVEGAHVIKGVAPLFPRAARRRSRS